MKRLPRFSSLLPASALLLIGTSVLMTSASGCSSDQACFYFTQVEYDIDNACPSREEALDFFQGDFCSTPIIGVDSDGTFDGETCCYEVTESDDFFGCAVGPEPVPPFPDTTVGVGGAGGIGGAGGSAGTGGTGANGGGEPCLTCVEFATTAMPTNNLCADSVSIYEAYTACVCEGACKALCGNDCATQMFSTECQSCISDSTSGCGMQYNACVSDAP